MALTDNLVAYYKLDGNSNDSVGSNNGSDTGITYSLANGKIDQGAGFSDNDLIVIANSGQFNFDGLPFTISMWIYPTSFSTSGTQTLIDFEKAGWIGWLLRHDLTKTYLSGNNDQRLSSSLPPLNTWTNIIFTSNGTNGKTYFNGKLDYTENSLTYNGNSNSNYGIGCNAENNTQSFIGSIDEVIVENRVWSAEEIKKYYTNSLGRF